MSAKAMMMDQESKVLDTGFTLASAKLMEKYVAEGALNPRINLTQTGFNCMFVAWLIEEDLPFTTGISLLNEPDIVFNSHAFLIKR
jgi:hypothetical protein